ncbi:MAG: glycosyltransferase family 4 protein [Acetobacteraceae bacterium]|nr:glycosyltransferase family 4 protein [Acetobacteraceae bacterium]
MGDDPRRLVITVFPSFAVGGAQARFASIANHFADRFRHTVIALNGDTSCRERIDSAVHIEYPMIALKKGNTLNNRQIIRRYLLETKPNVLVTCNFGSLDWVLANTPKLMRHMHIEDGFGPDERVRQIPRRVWLRRLLLRRSQVVLPSRNLLAIATNIWRLPQKNLHYIPNGIDLVRFGTAVPEMRWPSNVGPVIGTVAALRAEKNLARLVRAFALVARATKCHLAIIGDGPERSMLQALAGELGVADHITFTGHSGAPQGLYRGLDIYALSSDTEQMPMTVLEAMAAGLPIAGTAVGDVAAMVTDDNRRLIVPLSDDALAASLRELVDDRALRTALGAANRIKVVQDYDQQIMFDAYAALFDGLPVRPGHP